MPLPLVLVLRTYQMLNSCFELGQREKVCCYVAEGDGVSSDLVCWRGCSRRWGGRFRADRRWWRRGEMFGCGVIDAGALAGSISLEVLVLLMLVGGSGLES